MNPSFRNIPAFILAAAASVPAAGSECYARLDGDTLRMGNDRIERVFLWNDGNLKTVAITDKASGRAWPIPTPVPDFAVNRAEASGGRLDARLVPADGIRPEHLEATVGFDLGSLSVRRVYRIYDGVAAIAVDTYLRGRLDGSPAAADAAAADRGNIESTEAMKVKPVTAVLDRVNPGGNHWHGRAVEFRDISDWNNNLVDERDFISYRKTNYRGNVLLLSDGLRPGGFVLLKEAPCSGVQLAYKNADFIADFGSFAVTGLGLESKDVTPDRWTRAYGSVLCTYDGPETEALKALRGYQKQTRILDPSRDEMVMMNTWGDRSQDAKVNEAFCLAELDRASRLGISLFQIDDGWQVGKSPNSAVAKGSFRDMHRSGDYWKPDPKKYPRGLRPVVEHGRRLGIEVGLWYNPSIQDDFADWQKDADNIIGLYRDYGIRMFKIDGLTVTSKLGEENLRRLFDRVLEATDNAVMFNLDATASRRCGYHYFNEYGNVFLENRYTDWGNYYPYQTLRNLWQLSAYVAPESLQIEFLNKWRNGGKYADGDTFAPGAYDFGYLFATTMAGQPLAWMEAANLPDEAFAIRPLVEAYRKVQHELHSGVILPIGSEPSGTSWTGFQSIVSPTEGFLLVYREATPEGACELPTRLPEGAAVSLTAVLGSGTDASLTAGPDGRLPLSLPQPNSFALYRYKILNYKP